MTSNSSLSTQESVYADGKYTCCRLNDDIAAWFGDCGVRKRLYLGRRKSPGDTVRRKATRKSGVVIYSGELLNLKRMLEDGGIGLSVFEIKNAHHRKRSFHIGPGRYLTVNDDEVLGLVISFWKGDDVIQIEYPLFLKLMIAMKIRFKEVTEIDYPWDKALPDFRREDLKNIL